VRVRVERAEGSVLCSGCVWRGARGGDRVLCSRWCSEGQGLRRKSQRMRVCSEGGLGEVRVMMRGVSAGTRAMCAGGARRAARGDVRGM
jgi:hypothetical protein